MERKIGEIFEYNGEWYQCVKSAICGECAFLSSICIDNPSIKCCADFRNDNCSVVFKKLEKVGEPIEFARGLYFQRYQLADSTAFYEGDTRLFFNAPTKTFVYIEIKIKEDMEEKKLNLKPFDIQKAKEGKQVCTRDGRKARIICFDAKGDKPIIALVEMGTAETPNNYPIDGKAVSAKETSCDLMMLPEKKEGWINIYNADTTFYYVDGRVFETKDEAIQESKEEVEKEQREKNEYIDTIRVEWEE